MTSTDSALLESVPFKWGTLLPTFLLFLKPYSFVLRPTGFYVLCYSFFQQAHQAQTRESFRESQLGPSINIVLPVLFDSYSCLASPSVSGLAGCTGRKGEVQDQHVTS